MYSCIKIYKNIFLENTVSIKSSKPNIEKEIKIIFSRKNTKF